MTGSQSGVSRRSVSEVFRRFIRLLCPACGNGSIIKRPFRIKSRCSSCGVRFAREEGFFVGAILVNVVTTEIVILILYLISSPIISAHYRAVLTTLFVVACTFPVVFYHHSWSIWLSFDHMVESLPKS